MDDVKVNELAKRYEHIMATLLAGDLAFSSEDTGNRYINGNGRLNKERLTDDTCDILDIAETMAKNAVTNCEEERVI